MRERTRLQRAQRTEPQETQWDQVWRSPRPDATSIGPEGGPVAAPFARGVEAGRGGGEALPEDTRAQMEDAFGHDFGRVRVHSGPDADALSRGIGASAFTTGSDVYFQRGAYEPQTPEGRRLLAHELTHVVQQQGMAAGGPMTVGPVGDAYEQEADAVASSVDSGAAASVGGTPGGQLLSRFVPGAAPDGSTSTGAAPGSSAPVTAPGPGEQAGGAPDTGAGIAGGAKIPIQNEFWSKGSFVEMGGQAGLHVFHKAATTSQPDIPERVENHTFTMGPGADPAVEPFSVVPGSKGQLLTLVQLSWKLQSGSVLHGVPVIGKLGELATSPDTGTATVQIRTDFEAKPDGIKFRTPRAIREDSDGGGAALSLPLTPSVDSSDTGGTVLLPVTLMLQGTAAFAGQTPATPLGLPVAQAQQQVNVNTAITRTFAVDLNADGGAKPPDPNPNPPDPKPTKNTKFFQQEVHFRVDSDKVDDPEFLKLRDWFHGKREGVGSGADLIPFDVQQGISDGKTVVHLFGQASNTGSPTHNLDLSDRRAKNVERILQDLAGSDAKFNLVADGPVEDGSTNEEAQARRVLIFFDADVSDTPTPQTPGGTVDSPLEE